MISSKARITLGAVQNGNLSDIATDSRRLRSAQLPIYGTGCHAPPASDVAAVENPEAFRCAVLLWCASWHQVPAASLPNDETKLARLAGYGRNVKAFQRARDAGGMRGWMLCAGGRWFHPTVAEKANEAYAAQKKQRTRTAAATASTYLAQESRGAPHVTPQVVGIM